MLAKLEIAAADLRTAGWRNVRVTIEDPEEQRRFRPAPYTRISLSDEDAGKLAALTEECETFEDIYEDELTEDQVARHDAIEAEMDAIQAREGADRASGARGRGTTQPFDADARKRTSLPPQRDGSRAQVGCEHPTGATGRQRGVNRHAGRATSPHPADFLVTDGREYVG